MTDQQFARAWDNIRQSRIRVVSTMLRKTQAAGGASGLDRDLVASAITWMVEYACYNWTARSGDFSGGVIKDNSAVTVLSPMIVQTVTSAR